MTIVTANMDCTACPPLLLADLDLCCIWRERERERECVCVCCVVCVRGGGGGRGKVFLFVLLLLFSCCFFFGGE